MSKSARKESKNASHLSHFIARHVLDKMPQRTTRVPDVAAMPELASHLLCCVSRAPGPMGRCPSTRPSLSSPPCRSPSPPYSAHGAVHHGRHAKLAIVLFPPLRASSTLTLCATSLAASCCASRARSTEVEDRRSTATTGADRRRRLQPWLGRHGLSPGHPRRPAGAR